MAFSVCFLSLSIIFSRLIHIVCFGTSLLFIDSLVWIIPHFTTHSSIDIHLGPFHFLAFMNNAATKFTYKFLSASFYLNICFCFGGYIPSSGIAGSYSDSMFSFLSNSDIVSSIKLFEFLV